MTMPWENEDYFEPWHPPESDCHPLEIPQCLRRDKNNVAPWMRHPDVTSPMTVGPETFMKLRVTVTDVNDGPSLYETIAEAINPAGSLPATAQHSPLPWEPKT